MAKKNQKKDRPTLILLSMLQETSIFFLLGPKGVEMFLGSVVRPNQCKGHQVSARAQATFNIFKSVDLFFMVFMIPVF